MMGGLLKWSLLVWARGGLSTYFSDLMFFVSWGFISTGLLAQIILEVEKIFFNLVLKSGADSGLGRLEGSTSGRP